MERHEPLPHLLENLWGSTVHLEVSGDEWPHQPRPDGALMVSGVAVPWVALVAQPVQNERLFHLREQDQATDWWLGGCDEQAMIAPRIEADDGGRGETATRLSPATRASARSLGYRISLARIGSCRVPSAAIFTYRRSHEMECDVQPFALDTAHVCGMSRRLVPVTAWMKGCSSRWIPEALRLENASLAAFTHLGRCGGKKDAKSKCWERTHAEGSGMHGAQKARRVEADQRSGEKSPSLARRNRRMRTGIYLPKVEKTGVIHL
jgi:hypothetical protein